MKNKIVWIDPRAGYAGDWMDPAEDLVQREEVRNLCFYCLAEGTLSIAQMEQINNPDKGYGQ